MNKKIGAVIVAALLAVAVLFLQGRSRKQIVFEDLADKHVSGYQVTGEHTRPLKIPRVQCFQILSAAVGFICSLRAIRHIMR